MFVLLTARFLIDLYDVLVGQFMVYTYTLRIKLDRATPNACMRKLIKEVFVNLHQC